jgi:serine phosphatase RsbU (regulator of sigma subunit)
MGGLPLGLTTRGSFREHEIALNSGDVVLLMTDGLPERSNEHEEWFGYERIQELFLNIADKNPSEICQIMEKSGNDWAGRLEQEDDVSFMVMKVR